MLCAEQHGTVAGVAAFRETDGTMTLTQLHVDPKRWRDGIGTALHSACVALWRRTGVHSARLEVFEHNEGARSFYSHHGWFPDPDEPRAGTHLVFRLAVPAWAVEGEE